MYVGIVATVQVRVGQLGSLLQSYSADLGHTDFDAHAEFDAAHHWRSGGVVMRIPKTDSTPVAVK